MTQHQELREKFADILRRGIRVRETVCGEKEYYFFAETVDKLIAAVKEAGYIQAEIQHDPLLPGETKNE